MSRLSKLGARAKARGPQLIILRLSGDETKETGIHDNILMIRARPA
jgi:hypothetical protein